MPTATRFIWASGIARRSDAVATVDIAQSLAASAFLLQGEFKRLGVALALPSPIQLLITGDAVRIEQVFINLLRNALDAVDEAQVREVSVTLASIDGYAVVRISDSGPALAVTLDTPLGAVALTCA